MPEKEEITVNAADFNSFKLKINLKNITTGAEIRDGKRSFGNQFDKKKSAVTDEILEVNISEFLEDGLSMEVPSKTCAENHSIEIELSTENTKPLVSFSSMLKVKSVEKISKDSDLIETVFTKKNQKDWDAFHGIYQQRQEEILGFFNAVKGY